VPEAFFSVRVVGEAHTKIVKRRERIAHQGYGYGQEVQAVDAYAFGYHEVASVDAMQEIPYAYLTVEISAPGAQTVTHEFKFEQPGYGTATVNGDEVTITSNFFGMTRTWKEYLTGKQWTWRDPSQSSSYYRQDYEIRTNPLKTLCIQLGKSTCPDSMDAWWTPLLDWNLPLLMDNGKLDDASLSSVMKRKDIKPVLDRLQKESPIDWKFFTWLWESKTRDKQKNNSLLSAMLTQIGTDYAKLLAALREARANVPTHSPEGEYLGYTGGSRSCYTYIKTRRKVCLGLPGAKEKVEDQEAKADFSKQKTNAGKAEGLGIDATKYPKLRAAVEKGHIPASVFANPDKQPVNREFAIWEKALTRKGWTDEIFKLSQDAGRRSTYEKDITPYLAFLFKIEKYLDRHAPGGKGVKKWSAMPKYVESQWKLEMDEAEDGTTKRRSAMTPEADNVTRTITVPFVAVCVTGVRTQWCYSRHYYVFEEGMIDPESEGVVVSDLEVKLNGRDDYGLMYFTLSGTDTARGYPTFLIIFERLAAKTRVHFHRVHPCRTKDGVKTLACNLVERCYQYMAGNIPAADITAQQGDLIFIKHPNDPIAAGAKVAEPQTSRKALVFESHAMVPVWDKGQWDGVVTDLLAGTATEGPKFKLYVSEAKTPKNRLGFLYAPGEFAVRHPEHDDIERLTEGWYEIRRCRSWEANPHAIWSLTID